MEWWTLRFLRKSSWCEITVIHQDKLSVLSKKQGDLGVRGCFFYQTSCSWFKGKFCWSSPWGKSFRNTSLEQCSKPRVVRLKNCLGNSDYHNDDSSRSIHMYIYTYIDNMGEYHFCNHKAHRDFEHCSPGYIYSFF